MKAKTIMEKVKQSRYTNEEYLEGIRKQDTKVIRSILDEYQGPIIHYVRKNSGTYEQGEDIFCDALEVIVRKVNKEELKLTCSFFTFLFEIAKRLWLKSLRRKKFESGVTIEDAPVLKHTDDIIEELMETERRNLYLGKFEKLGKVCKQLIQLTVIEGKSMKAVAQIMNYKSEAMAKTKKYKCKKRLIKLIENDPVFKDLKF